MTATPTTGRVLSDLSQLSREQLIAMVEAARNAPAARIVCKVTAAKIDPKTGKPVGTNGAIAVYGLGRFPVTLYWSQWQRLLDHADAIRAFAAANASSLATKA